MLVVKCRQLFAHPLFLDQIEKLTAAVGRAKAKDPKGFQKTANAEVLAALRKLVLETIPFVKSLCTLCFTLEFEHEGHEGFHEGHKGHSLLSHMRFE